MLDNLLCNVHRLKIQIYFHDFFFEFFKEERCIVCSERCTVVHLPLIFTEIPILFAMKILKNQR